MQSLYDHLKECEELRQLDCDWCSSFDGQFYRWDGEVVCEKCLESEEYESPEHGLTLRERNE